MRQLLLLRHAKSALAQAGMGDFDRPLNDRGRQAAPMIGKEIAKRELIPDLILCSTAKRAQETLDLVLPHLGEIPIRLDDKLYLATPRLMLEKLHSVGPEHRRVMIVAHNPGLHMLALGLAGSGKRNALTQLNEKYPTAALAVLDFDCGWKDLVQGDGCLSAFIRPRDLL